MAKRLFTSAGLTFTASAAGSAATQTAYMALKGGSTTQLIDVLEVMVTGKETASVVGGVYLARASALGTGPIALAAPHSDGPAFPNATALSSTVVPYVSATTQPIPSNTVTDAKIDLALNFFGGISRWNAAPLQQWQIIGNAATAGESILWNSSTGNGATGKADAHILYEPY